MCFLRPDKGVSVSYRNETHCILGDDSSLTRQTNYMYKIAFQQLVNKSLVAVAYYLVKLLIWLVKII